MTIDKLLRGLAQNKVTLFLDGDRLRYRAPEGSLTPDMRAAIAQHRTAIIGHIQAKLSLSPQQPVKCITCDRQYWIDEPPKNGRIRTTCGKCGQFIGYRPENPFETRDPLAIPRNLRQL